MLMQWKMINSTVTQMLISLAITNILLRIVCSEKLVVDTDGGADDAAAILLLLSAWEKHQSDFEIEAITCVNGNTMERTVEENVLKIHNIHKIYNCQRISMGGPEYFWYLTDLINALQGVLIFIVVGCQPQVWTAVKRIWSSKTGRGVMNTTNNVGHSSSSHGLPSIGESVTNNTFSNTTSSKIPMETIC